MNGYESAPKRQYRYTMEVTNMQTVYVTVDADNDQDAQIIADKLYLRGAYDPELLDERVQIEVFSKTRITA